jgi:hypothetical protein
MDSSPDLSVKLRRGSSDSRDSFYMGFAQGIDSDIEIEQVTPAPPPPPPLYPDPEEPPIDIPPPPVVEEPSEPEELVVILVEDSEVIECEEQENEEIIVVENDEVSGEVPRKIEFPGEVEFPSEESSEPTDVQIEQIFPPPPLCDEDDDEKTNTSVTVIQSKNKPPSSSSSSISSALNELAADDASKSLSHPVESPKPRTQSVEAEIATSSPSSHKSSSSHKSPPLRKSPKSPPRKLNLYKETPPSRHRNFDSDSNDSINAIDCKIDDDNREDSSPTDSMPQHPTPPPLGFPLSLEKR